MSVEAQVNPRLAALTEAGVATRLPSEQQPRQLPVALEHAHREALR